MNLWISDGQREHKERGDCTQFNSSAKPKTFGIPKDESQFLIAHLRQRRIHHDESDGDGMEVMPTCKLLSAAGMPGMK